MSTVNLRLLPTNYKNEEEVANTTDTHIASAHALITAEENPPLITKAAAEAGIDTAEATISAVRLKEAIIALTPGAAPTTGEANFAAADQSEIDDPSGTSLRSFTPANIDEIAEQAIAERLDNSSIVATAGNAFGLEQAGHPTRIPAPSGGTFRGTAGLVGKLRITLPQSWTNTAIGFDVKVGLFEENQSFVLRVFGYMYLATTRWLRTSAFILNDLNHVVEHPVTFGHDGTNCFVEIGTDTDVWNNPNVGVFNVIAGWSDYDVANWIDGWNVSVEISAPVGEFTTITKTAYSKAIQDNAIHAASSHAPANAEANYPVISQVSAEEGTATDSKTWTAERVKQAILALAPAATDISGAISALKGSPPETLDTLEKLAAAIGDDPNFAASVGISISSVSAALNTLNVLVDSLNYSQNSLGVGSTKGIGIYAGSGQFCYILAPGGATYKHVGSATGKIRIVMPAMYANNMIKMSISVFDYRDRESFDVECAGYAYSANGGVTTSWARTSARIIGDPGVDREFSVSFGDNGTGLCIEIGEDTSIWDYPQIRVTNVTVGHVEADLDTWKEGWSIEIATEALTNVHSTLTNNSVKQLTSVLQTEIDSGLGNIERTFTPSQLTEFIQKHGGTHAPITSSSADPV